VPTCDHVSARCNANTDAGNLARFACGATCGCDSPASSLPFPGPNYGCQVVCKKAAEDQAARSECSDAHFGLAELVEFATSDAVRASFDKRSNKTAWETLGCFALSFNLRTTDDLCDWDGSRTKSGEKTFMPFCPVFCGCIEDPSITGCPVACKATDQSLQSNPKSPTPVCRDLSDTQLATALAG
jgi:hypothetical protein